MPLFVFGLVLLVVGAILAVIGKLKVDGGPGRNGIITPPRVVRFRTAGVALAAIGVVVAIGSSARLVGATDVGVPVTLGKIGQPLGPGIHLVAPWTQVNSFSTRLQQSDMSQTIGEGDRTTTDGIEVLSSEGGRMVLDVTVRYAVNKESAGDLFRRVGSMTGIRENVVRPDVRSGMRDVYSRHTAEDGYATKREAIALEAETLIKERLAPFGLTIDAVKVRNITLETNLQTQITAKLEAKQAAERALIEQQQAQTVAETRRKVAETDAQATVIAAKGQAEANLVLASSLTDALLKSKEIDAITKNTNTVLYPYGQPVSPIVDGRGTGNSGGAVPAPPATPAVTTPAVTTPAVTTPPTTVKPGG